MCVMMFKRWVWRRVWILISISCAASCGQGSFFFFRKQNYLHCAPKEIITVFGRHSLSSCAHVVLRFPLIASVMFASELGTNQIKIVGNVSLTCQSFWVDTCMKTRKEKSWKDFL